MNQSIFITGTDTNIGKTFIASMMFLAAKLHQMDVCYFKPVQTGDDSDCNEVKLLTNGEDRNIIQPVYSFALPATPYLAARVENKEVDSQKICRRFQEISFDRCIVEGAGGLLVPLSEKMLIRDLIKALNIPILIVASTRLGTMNHTLLTVESALNAGIAVKGIVLSGDPYPNLAEVLHRFSTVRVLAEVPKLDKSTF
ncbi:MAG: bioD, partial [Gammaproteobacteria bacterium]|nr:bioD [Gammaproteobacteria bacterium]